MKIAWISVGKFNLVLVGLLCLDRCLTFLISNILLISFLSLKSALHIVYYIIIIRYFASISSSHFNSIIVFSFSNNSSLIHYLTLQKFRFRFICLDYLLMLILVRIRFKFQFIPFFLLLPGNFLVHVDSLI